LVYDAISQRELAAKTSNQRIMPKKIVKQPQVFVDALKLIEIGEAIKKHLTKKGFSSELNIHLYPK
jgi:hypothetical protein